MKIYYIDLRNLKRKPAYAELLKVGECLTFSLFAAVKDPRQLAVAQLYVRGNQLTGEQLESLQKRAEDSTGTRERSVERTQIYGLILEEEQAVDRAVRNLLPLVPPPSLDLDELAAAGRLARGVYQYQGTDLLVNEDQEAITDSHLRKIANFKHGSIYIWYNARFFLERDDDVVRAIVTHLPTIVQPPEEEAEERARQPVFGGQRESPSPLTAPEAAPPSLKEWSRIGLGEQLDQYVERSPLRPYTPQERAQVEGFYNAALDQLEQTADPLAKRQNFKASEIRQQRRFIESTVQNILRYWDLMAHSLNRPGKSNYLVTQAFKASVLAMQVATSMKLAKKDVINLGMAATLQDVGLRDLGHLLDKTTPLVPAELAELQQHPLRSVRLLERSEGLPSTVLQTVLQAHERFDGSGYPQGLAGSQIHLPARILAAVNTYVAMISPRPFRPPLPPYNAIVTIVTHAYHSLLDREVAKSLLDVLSVCPVGMLVKLDTGAIARVTSAHDQLYTRPVVALLYAADGSRCDPPLLLDLAASDLTIAEIVSEAEIPDVDALSQLEEFAAMNSGKVETES